MAAEECDIRFMKIGLTGGILQSIVCSGPLFFDRVYICFIHSTAFMRVIRYLDACPLLIHVMCFKNSSSRMSLILINTNWIPFLTLEIVLSVLTVL